ncbi:DegV family protein [Thermosipho atlanticus]|uniref:EDD domain protein, DegV family n=1 Tax=Thermosipho atlanticus DSM 15807 TaxID=1123380 RepID=A0A1M5U8J9_9BACT|nr:DegV family protein [Thermosipho atlanticus]SHH59385.1 EDD domain protein, DegV family [Thermosipho atlanticus DSM 15807]
MIKIITDSASDLPKQIIENYSIEIIPFTVEINGKTFKDGIDISAEEFNKIMITTQQLPRTAHPSPEIFKETFLKYTSLGYNILCLTISSKLSGSYQAAIIAKNMLNSNKEIIIFDTLAASLGEGLQVIKAAELIKDGYNLPKIVNILKKYRDELNILILLDTLENIVKGGRLSRIKGTVAKILNFKIILRNMDGTVEMLEKIRGTKRLFNRVLEIIESNSLNLSNKIVGITHVANIETAEKFKKIIQEKFKPKNIFINHMGATLATYAGNRGIIISF